MKKRKLLWIAIPVLLWFVITGLFMAERIKTLSQPWPDGDYILVKGTIYRSGHTSNATTIYLKNISISSKPDADQSDFTKEIFNKTNILAYLKDEQEFSIGDNIIVQGKCSYPSSPMNPGGFNGMSYYSAQNVYMTLKKAVIQERTEGSWYYKPAEFFHRLSEKVATVIGGAAEDTESAILKSLLLGDRSDLDEEVKSIYQDNGIIHVLAISGLHISMIGMSLFHFFKKRCRLSYFFSSLISLGFVVGYGFLTGFPTSAIRATLMFFIYLGAQILGRTYDMPISMTLAAVIMLCRNPQLLSQSGFLLSFGAIAGVYTCQLFESEKLKKSSLGVSFSVWLVTLPITAYFFFQVPIIGIFLNLLVVPSMTIIIIAGIIGTILAFISIPCGTFVMAPVHYILKLTIWVCDKVRMLPGAVWITGKPAIWQVIVYYILLYVILIWVKPSRFMKITRGAGIMLAVFILCFSWSNLWSVTFLNVGQGDALCLKTQKGHVYIVDGGSSSMTKVGQYILEPYLKCKGYATVEGWFISHYDNDHVNGLIEILEDYKVNLIGHNTAGITIKRIILPQLEVEEEYKKQILKLAEKNKIPVSYVSRNDQITDNGTSFYIYSPKKNVMYEDSNAGSMVFKVEYKDFSVLMTGDVQGKGEEDLLEVDMGEIDVLKLAHHGSKNSSAIEILEHIDPRIAVVSCGVNNRYGHPHKEVLDNLKKLKCQVLRTDVMGPIELKVKE